MPPKKKFKVRNPGNPIVVPKEKAKPKPKMESKPKKKVFKVRNPGDPRIISQKPQFYGINKPLATANFNSMYLFNTKLNQFINDKIDSKSYKTNRKVGLTRVKDKFDKLTNKIPFPTIKEVKDFYNKEFPDDKYYLIT